MVTTKGRQSTKINTEATTTLNVSGARLVDPSHLYWFNEALAQGSKYVERAKKSMVHSSGAVLFIGKICSLTYCTYLTEELKRGAKTKTKTTSTAGCTTTRCDCAHQTSRAHQGTCCETGDPPTHLQRGAIGGTHAVDLRLVHGHPASLLLLIHPRTTNEWRQHKKRWSVQHSFDSILTELTLRQG